MYLSNDTWLSIKPIQSFVRSTCPEGHLNKNNWLALLSKTEVWGRLEGIDFKNYVGISPRLVHYARSAYCISIKHILFLLSPCYLLSLSPRTRLFKISRRRKGLIHTARTCAGAGGTPEKSGILLYALRLSSTELHIMQNPQIVTIMLTWPNTMETPAHARAVCTWAFFLLLLLKGLGTRLLLTLSRVISICP